MNQIEPARMKPSVKRETMTLPADTTEVSPVPVRGRALIFWDPKVPGKRKKLDAIDTDQITPAADCVSESLDTLDERWKAGAFRYLMPDFRDRVHRGETFLDCRRSLRHRIVARDEPGGPERAWPRRPVSSSSSCCGETWATSSDATR